MCSRLRWWAMSRLTTGQHRNQRGRKEAPARVTTDPVQSVRTIAIAVSIGCVREQAAGKTLTSSFGSAYLPER